MKLVFKLSTAAVLFFSTNGFMVSASSGTDPDFVASLPRLSKSSLFINYGPPLAAVQPTANLLFTYWSCGAAQFDADVEEVDGLLYVAISKNHRSLECFGPAVKRDYSVQISSDYSRQPVVVLNPIALDDGMLSEMPFPNNPGRICTAIAGSLFNPMTGECEFFRNGCQRAELISQGLQQPENGQCQ